MAKKLVLKIDNFISTRNYIFIFIFINIFLSAWFVINTDIEFHTDIARDFLILEDIVYNGKLTLIGPRSGGISGVFHGPAWIYLNLSAFVLGKGNPVIVGWFWVLLSAISIGITYIIGKQLFNKITALLASFLLSILAITYTKSLFNPFGAVILFPLFFFLLHKYLNNFKLKLLFLSFFVLGFIIQFQIAFGVPILILTVLYLIKPLYSRKLLKHFISLFALLIPLSTYILFELRHNFLQIRSVISYLTTKQIAGELSIWQLITQRIRGVSLEGLYLSPYNMWIAFPASILIFILILKIFKGKKLFWRSTYLLFFYYYFGFWIITFLYKGVVWDYYYWPFLPISLLIFVSTYRNINKRIFLIIYMLIISVNLWYGINIIKHVGSGWVFYSKLAKTIFNDAKNEFGYYIYTPDQFGYSPRYAMNYISRDNLGTRVRPFQKRNITYLIIAPAPEGKKFLESTWWEENQIKINRKPDLIFKFDNGYIIKKFYLTNKEISIPSDPYLLQDLTFR